MRWHKRLLVVILAIFIGILLAACGNIAETSTGKLVNEVAPKVNYLAPDFRLNDYASKEVRLSGFKGKPVLINFWATWCPPCRAEMPEIEGVYRKYKEKYGLVILGIDAREDNFSVKKYVEAGGYSWDMPMDYEGRVVTNYGVVAFPTSFFVDRQGYIRATQIGGMDKMGLEERLSKILYD